MSKDLPDPPEPEKSTRLDKVVVEFENKYHRFLSVKKKLNTFARKTTKNKQVTSIIPLIQQNVKTLNRITHLSYLLLNFHFLRVLQDPKKKIKKSIIQTDLYRVFSAVSTCNGKLRKLTGNDIEWNQSVIEFRKHLNDSIGGTYILPDRKYCCNLINNSVKFMLVAVKNHFNLNFRARLTKYLRYKYKEENYSKAYYWSDRILNIRTLNSSYPSKFDNDKVSEKIIKEYRECLKITSTAQINISDNLDVCLPLLHKILLYFKDSEKKLFSLLPLKGELTPSYIKICNSSLHDMVGRTELSKAEFMKTKYANWNRFFKVDHVETYKHKFSYELLTNGYDVSILLKIQINDYPKDYSLDWDILKKADYIKKKQLEDKKLKDIQLKAIKEQKLLDKNLGIKPAPKNLIRDYLRTLNWYDYDAHLGVDPGRRKLFSAISGTEKNDIKVHCTREEWNHLTRFKCYRTKINKRKDAEPLIASLNKISFKTGFVSDFIKSLKLLVPKLDKIFEFYGKNFYRKANFSMYLNKQKAFNKLVKRLQIGKKTLVGFGDGCVNSNGCCKGQKLPVKQLYNRINREKNMRAAYVNEANSTKMCHICHHETSGSVKIWKQIEKVDGSSMKVKVTIYGLRRCTNNECRITWDRDHNARINIYICLRSEILNGIRPEYLCNKGVKKISPKTKKVPLIKKKTSIIKKPVEGTSQLTSSDTMYPC